ncbi:MAG: RpiB/LacA/LacB family sugar-phosphate isomerase, partial [Elusimicrobia bacterium]|nr:RpiB/LacA/LacB family sugar-phosphate isomerase [Elusimicrobiota bacterium]
TLGHEVTDFGCYSSEAVDYPDVAQLVAEAVTRGEHQKGFLLDGFGGAVCFVANKVPGVRAVCAYDLFSAKLAAQHDDANVLCLGGKTHGELILQEIVKTFLSTPFEGGRHERRLAKVQLIEKKYSIPA